VTYAVGFERDAGHPDGPCWCLDDDGSHRRDQAFADWRALELGAGMQREAPSQQYIGALEWDRQMDAMNVRVDWSVVAETEDAGRTLGLAHEAGLVSVLSKAKEPSRVPSRQRKPAASLAVQASQRAAVQAAGAFVAGGSEARMAKLRMAVGFAARLHGAPRKGHRPFEVRMITLTYRDAKAWRPLHVKRFMDHVRVWHVKRGLKPRYVWVAELQDGKRRKDGVGRNAVHYHIALWLPVDAPLMPKPDDAGWWKHGITRIETAKHAVSYLMHYLKKSNSKHFGSFPDGCRLYSVGGLDHADRRARRWLRLPAFVQGNSSIFDNWRRRDGGGWLDPGDRFFPSEFRRCSIAGTTALQRVHTHARTLDAKNRDGSNVLGGPFAWLSDRDVALAGACGVR